jgi:capsular polysaccharide biosynthesis protein
MWISRTAIVGGVASQTYAYDVDWNLKRGRNEFIIFVFKVKFSQENEVFLNPAKGLKVYEVNNLYRSEEDIVVKFKNATLVHAKNVIQGENLCYPKFDEKFSFSGWPTYSPYFHNNQIRLIPPIHQTVRDSGLLFLFDNNWFHFLIETMSALVPFESEIQKENIILPSNTFPQVSDALRMFSPRSFIDVSFLHAITFSEIKVINLKVHRGIDLEARKNDVLQLREFVNCKIKEPRSHDRKKIYLKRKPGLFRDLNNRSTLEQNLLSKGYQCLDFSYMTFLEQYRCVRSASTIVAETGAALTNAIFAFPECRIVELKPKGEYSVFEHLINILGLDYTCIETLPDGKGNYNFNMKDIVQL